MTLSLVWREKIDGSEDAPKTHDRKRLKKEAGRVVKWEYSPMFKNARNGSSGK